MMVLAEVVDWAALGEVIAVSLVGGVGVTFAFSLALLGAVRSADMRRDERFVEAGAYAALGLIGLAVTAAALVFGIIVMTSKG
jgi:hypothetical protein